MKHKLPPLSTFQDIEFHLMSGKPPLRIYACPTPDCLALLFSFEQTLKLRCKACNKNLVVSDLE